MLVCIIVSTLTGWPVSLRSRSSLPTSHSASALPATSTMPPSGDAASARTPPLLRLLNLAFSVPLAASRTHT